MTTNTTRPALSPTAPTGYNALFAAGRGPLSLAIVLLILLASLDQLIVATAMPTILAELGDAQLYSWAFAAYTLASIAALPMFGALAGRWGLRSTMLLALSVFAAGSVLGAVAPSMPVLLGGRAVQGLGAGGLFALPFLMISQRFPAELQPRALALTSGVWGISSLTGPLAGALLLKWWGWPAIFWVNLPLVGVVLLFGWFGLRGAEHGSRSAAPANLLSPLLLTLTTGLLLAAPTIGTSMGWVLGGAGIAVALLFGVVERRSAQPIVPAVAWRARGPLGAALAVIALANLTFFAAETFLPLLMQSGRGKSPVEVGVLISAGAVAWTLGALWSGRQPYPRLRRRVHGALGMLLFGVLLLLPLVTALPVEIVYPAWVLAGLGMGVAIHTSNVVVLDNARGAGAATTVAAGQLALNLGTVAGTALAGAVAQLGFGANFTPGHGDTAVNPAQIALLERGVVYALALAVAAGIATLLVTRGLPRARQADSAPAADDASGQRMIIGEAGAGRPAASRRSSAP